MDLWRLRLNPPKQRHNLLQKVLSVEEIGRADRFRFERDRTRFVAARAQLRIILGSYLSTGPQTITFSYGPRGKPHVAEPVGFNLSHSEELAVIAVALERNVGVDIEAVRAIRDMERIAGRFFSVRENASLLSSPQNERTEAFFRCWTLKEAYVKATGDGLAQPTHAFDVAFARGERIEMVSVNGKPGEASRWKLFEFSPTPSFVGALAVEGHDWKLRRFNYEL